MICFHSLRSHTIGLYQEVIRSLIYILSLILHYRNGENKPIDDLSLWEFKYVHHEDHQLEKVNVPPTFYHVEEAKWNVFNDFFKNSVGHSCFV